MSDEEMVAVPVRLLKQLEAARVGLYDKFDDENRFENAIRFQDDTANFTIIEMMDHTEVMWELSHRRWEKVLTTEPNDV